MARIIEYKGKQVLSQNGISIPKNILINSGDDINKALEEYDLSMCL